jgi:hypothetical protein
MHAYANIACNLEEASVLAHYAQLCLDYTIPGLWIAWSCVTVRCAKGLAVVKHGSIVSLMHYSWEALR